MDEGIKINDIACEISTSGLESLLAKNGAELKVTRLDCEVSEAGLNQLMQRYAPAGTTPSAELGEGRVTLGNRGDRGDFRLELCTGNLHIEIGDGVIRLRTDSGA